MKHDAEVFKIPYKYGDTIRLKPLADIHFGSRHCDVKALKSFLGPPDSFTYFIGIGDFLDSIIISDLKRYRKSSDGSPGEVDEIIDYQVKNLAEILKPYSTQILGLGLGNHENEIIKRCGTNPLKRLADELGTKYLGYSWLVKMTLRRKTGGGFNVVIRGHHGWGGGSRTQGADLTKYSRDCTHFEADLFLYGHVHKLLFDEIPRLSLSADKLISRPKHICLCGTFLKTYSDGVDPTYSEVGGYPPVAIGGLTISLRPIDSRVDIKISKESF